MARLALPGLFMTFSLAAVIPAASSDGGQPGPYAAGHIGFVLTQPSGRPVAVDVWYPVDACDVGRRTAEARYVMDPFFADLGYLGETTSGDWEALGYDPAYERPRPSKRGPFPLLVYSSGFTFPTWANLFLATRLASHGYVVAAIQHYGEAAFSWHPWDGFFRIAFNRPRDVSFVLTELLKLNRRHGHRLHGTIDPQRIAAGGHSFGGYTALVLAAGDDTACDSKSLLETGDVPSSDVCGPTPPDQRISALVTLEPSGQVMRFEEMARVSVPSLVMGGAVEQQSPVLDEWRSWIARTHAAAGPRKAFRVDLQDTDHFSYSSYCDGVTMLHDRGAISDTDWDSYFGVFFCNAALPVGEGHRLISRFVASFLDGYLRRGHLGKSSLDRLDAEEPLAEAFKSEACNAGGIDHATMFSYRPHHGQCEVGLKNPPAWF